MHNPNVYQYQNYRVFLKDMFEYRMKSNKLFSHKYFAKKAGLQGYNILSLLINGKINLSEENMKKVAKGFGLKVREKSHFENLVHMNQAQTHEEKNSYFIKMCSANGFIKVHKIEKSKFDYFTNWYTLAIREVLLFGDRRYEAEDIVKILNPKITVEQAGDSIRLLQDLGLINKDNDGKWVKVDCAVSTGPEIRSLAITNYHLNMLQMTQDVICTIDDNEPQKNCFTMGIKASSIKKVKERIVEFRQEMLAMVCDEVDLDEAIQINIQAFPLTEKLNP